MTRPCYELAGDIYLCRSELDQVTWLRNPGYVIQSSAERSEKQDYIICCSMYFSLFWLQVRGVYIYNLIIKGAFKLRPRVTNASLT